ncbi:MAG TPA: NAD-dependent epimerase/dehydratase family protein [Phototrophicaceae bacterium]|nr:NAD-dependent epimerase/dehydratase family protein [Phototrophicaceae bacterium]
MVKALVTGGTGFVGSHLARALVAGGHTVRVLHRSTSRLDALSSLNYESTLGDILEPEALRAACAGCDWVFHVAAIADYWRADTARMFKANVDGTRLVLEAARAAGVRRVVFTSSAAAVGIRADGQPADETLPFNLPPERFPYGYSKVLAEQVVQEAVAAGQEVVIVNPTVVIGPGDLNMISGSYITQVKRFGALVPITSGGISAIDVRDVAQMHIAAAERGRSGQRYILGTANYTQREWLAMIADVVGVRRPVLTLPDWVLPPIATGIDGLRRVGISTPIDSNQTRLGARNIYFDFSKAWAELCRPQVDMRQSLEDTYHWYREHGYIG